jgi:L-asparaginase
MKEDLAARIPEIFQFAEINLTIMCQRDSTNMGPPEWAELCRRIVHFWQDCDGFVIIHGTDTLASAASFLALSLSGLTKPVVLTGSQRPLTELRSDARLNLIDAVALACMRFPEVMVCFDSDVYLASRVTKTSNINLGAFCSPNFPKLGHFGVEPGFDERLVSPVAPSLEPPVADTRHNLRVVSFRALPSAPLPEPVARAAVASADGILLQGFGLGHAPLVDGTWLYLCSEAQASRIPVVMTSQCGSGRVDLDLYEVGRQLRNQGVIPALDMTTECTCIKLMMALGRGVPYEEIPRFLLQPKAKEISSSHAASVLATGAAY